MKFLSKISFVIILFFLLVFPKRIAKSCFDSEPLFVGYSILNPLISEIAVEKPFTFTYANFNWDDSHHENSTDKNLEEWQQYFCGKPSLGDLHFLIYKSIIPELEQLRNLQDDKNASIPDTLKNSSITSIFKEHKFEGFIEYLIYAKECEPYFVSYEGWESSKSPTHQFQELMEKGIVKYENEDDEFLKLRYGFQIFRLARYENIEVEKTYEKYVAPLSNVKSIIQNKSLEHLGGWLTWSKNKKEVARGNALLAKSLIGNLERGLSVYLSFRISENTDWQLTHTQCKTKKERAMLHYIRALEKHSIALSDMETIYKLFPNTQALEILMTREIQKIELKFLQKKIKNRKAWDEDFSSNYGIPSCHVLNYIERIKPFVKKVANEKKCHRPAFWMMIDGYLEYLTRNNRTAQKLFSKAKKVAPKNSFLFDQIELLEFATLLSLMNTMEAWMEPRMWEIIKNNKAFVKHERFEPDFFMEKMASFYAQRGEVAKAYLCNYTLYGLKFYPNVKDTKAVLELWDKPDKNDFEKYLLKDEEIKTREELVDLWGTSLLGEHRYEEAAEVFKTIPNFGEKIKNPFLTYLFEFKLDKKYPLRKTFSKYEIALKVAEYENQILQKSEEAAAAHLALANYHYNTSFFGFAWKVKDYFISGGSWGSHSSDYNWYGLWTKGNREFMNLAPARKHLKKVFELTDDKEKQAQATLILSKLEKINNALRNYGKENNAKRNSKYYIQQLKDKYGDTKFYEKFSKECALFDKY